MRKPFIKFICNSSSYFTFLCKLIENSLPSIIIENEQENKKPNKSGDCTPNHFFLSVLLILASQRIEDIVGWDLPSDTTKRGSLPSVVEYGVLAWVAG